MVEIVENKVCFFFRLSLQAQHITALTDRCALFSCVESVTVE
jgi:hypothetical protein